MSRGTFDNLLGSLIKEISVMLEPEGFIRRQRSLRAAAGGNVAIINFQKSDKSSNQRLLFTVNLGIVCGALLDPQRTEIARADIIDAHLRTRLGMLFENPADQWWELSASTDVRSLSDELSRSISQTAVPYLKRYFETGALVELWKSGASPGLTVVQRSRFLSQLQNGS